ncbi:hypothetical protein S40288_08840 [Stachybotrys chartarum IBT 40288]|nr:hypothetical protein S40288_08840 [Stachybotrys chartarum IBT 40288]
MLDALPTPPCVVTQVPETSMSRSPFYMRRQVDGHRLSGLVQEDEGIHGALPTHSACRLVAHFLSHLLGVLHAARTHNLPGHEVLCAIAGYLVPSFFGDDSAYTWNDVVDAPIASKAALTRSRALPRGLPRGGSTGRSAGLHHRAGWNAVRVAVTAAGTQRIGVLWPQACPQLQGAGLGEAGHANCGTAGGSHLMGGHPGRQLVCDEDGKDELGFGVKSTAESCVGLGLPEYRAGMGSLYREIAPRSASVDLDFTKSSGSRRAFDGRIGRHWRLGC